MTEIIFRMKLINFVLPLRSTIILVLMGVWAGIGEIRAQDITKNNLSWPCAKFGEIGGGNLGNGRTKLNVFKKERIEWRSDNGDLIYQLSIIETTGSWADVSKHGEITYKVSSEKKRGIVFIKKSGETVKIKLLLVGKEGQSIYDLSSHNPEIIK